jgi:hypothetical protein
MIFDLKNHGNLSMNGKYDTREFMHVTRVAITKNGVKP